MYEPFIYLVLDENNLELAHDDEGNRVIFNEESEAIAWSEKFVTGWQVIEVPFQR